MENLFSDTCNLIFSHSPTFSCQVTLSQLFQQHGAIFFITQKTTAKKKHKVNFVITLKQVHSAHDDGVVAFFSYFKLQPFTFFSVKRTVM